VYTAAMQEMDVLILGAGWIDVPDTVAESPQSDICGDINDRT